MFNTGASLTKKLLEDTPGDALDGGSNAPAFDMGEHYWLARPAYSTELAQEICDRFSRHANEWKLSSTPLAVAMWHAYRVYHGLEDGQDQPVVSLTEAGEQGEFLRLFTNHYRGLVRQQNAIITSDRLAWDVQARTTDSEALRQVTLTQNICDWAVDARAYGPAFARALECMRVLGVAYVAQGWNPNAGINGSGDIWRSVLAPWECCHEDVREHQDATWDIFLRWESRWEWAAKFHKTNPDQALKIINLDPESTEIGSVRVRDTQDERGKDRIPVLYLYAIPTRAVPEGRLTILAGTEKNLILYDGPYPYGNERRVRRMCAGSFIGTEVPLANSWTLLPIQQAHDVINSVVITRTDLFGVPNIAVPDGVDFEASDIGGANKIGMPPGAENAPAILDFLQIPGSLGNEREACVEDMQMLAGIDSVTRGNPDENITSGSMAALVQQTARQFNSEDERAYVTCVEQVMSDMLAIYQRHASEAQLISIAGKSQRYSAREFRKEDLSLVQRVTVKVGNPMMRTIGGRIQVADKMLEQGLFKHPNEYMSFIHTGVYESLYSEATNELATISAENEAMARGESPHVDIFDNDAIHIREHRCQIDTQLRNDAQAIEILHKHLMAHMKSWQEKTLNSPDILEAIGQPPLSAAQAARQQAEQMQGQNPPAGQEGPGQAPIPGAQPSKGKPGPAPAPPGAQQPQNAPNMPAPAEAPRSP